MDEINKGSFEEIVELEEEQNYSSGFHSYRSGERFMNESKYSQMKESTVEEDIEGEGLSHSGVKNKGKQNVLSELFNKMKGNGVNSFEEGDSLARLYEMDSESQLKDNIVEKELTDDSGLECNIREDGIQWEGSDQEDVQRKQMICKGSFWKSVWKSGYVATPNTPLINKSKSMFVSN